MDPLNDAATSPYVLSLNVGRLTPVPHSDAPSGGTGIDKRPVAGPLHVSAPGPKGIGGSGVEGDVVADLRHHGGDDQAVYAFAREDLDAWERELGRPLANGAFGENLTTSGLDVSHALIGERWRIGGRLLLEVTGGRVPCRTFAGHVGEDRWVKRFTRRAETGAYLRVLEAGPVRAGDPVVREYVPEHGVTASLAFRANTTERALLPRLLPAARALHPEALAAARAYVDSGQGS
ncbi:MULTISPECIES: MOSC domain-containing protein [unclassified Streptomyces]|uniref:MOSC domain-containing protein n=1 Tax=unclassified Streptomyces TaxID=2593676 RepID=UPI0001B56E5F|nr:MULTISPECIES: MOSC domain-containing protein [unclassified Streptomyces]MYR29259.1 MOSC domain-containing protein [Streptomyces sp. SID4945]SCD89750.1 MOSC domain-containing protein YiiM [Streptomyces sp. TverLS-915]SCF45154.1 MOSC domain-containing protein YiiM [Streptomyces sp. LcepLS]